MLLCTITEKILKCLVSHGAWLAWLYYHINDGKEREEEERTPVTVILENLIWNTSCFPALACLCENQET